MPTPYSIHPATSPSSLTTTLTLFKTYAASLEIDLTFQNADEEFSSLPGKYGPPHGILLLARRRNPASPKPHLDESDSKVDQGEALGCIAVRALHAQTCEMKRLYVSPAARGMGLGRALALRAIDEARRLGYEAMVLDTLPSMESARALYKGLGFVERDAYYETPIQGTIFLELDLKRACESEKNAAAMNP